MRFLFLLLALATTNAYADAPNARAAYVERRGVLELDARCRLFEPNIRQALRASAQQARNALLRGGWTSSQTTNLESVVVAAAQSRACADPRTASSASDARRAAATWVGANAMTFPGWLRNWSARRAPDPLGWRLSQPIDGPMQAAFGVRQNNGREQLTLLVPASAHASNATITMRNPARGSTPDIALPQRVALGLAAGAPSPWSSEDFSNDGTTTFRDSSGHDWTALTFDNAAFRDLLALDPRESVAIQLGERNDRNMLVEVGDVAVARAFLAIN